MEPPDPSECDDDKAQPDNEAELHDISRQSAECTGPEDCDDQAEEARANATAEEAAPSSGPRKRRRR